MTTNILTNLAFLAGAFLLLMAGFYAAWVEVRVFRFESELKQKQDDLAETAEKTGNLKHPSYLATQERLIAMRRAVPDLSVQFLIALSEAPELSTGQPTPISECEDELMAHHIRLTDEWSALRLQRYICKETVSGWFLTHALASFGITKLSRRKGVNLEFDPIVDFSKFNFPSNTAPV